MKNEMKMKNLCYLLGVLSLLFVGCSDDDGTSVLVPEVTEVVLSGDGESKTIAVNCDGDWNVEVSEAWCKALREKQISFCVQEICLQLLKFLNPFLSLQSMRHLQQQRNIGLWI